MTSPDDSPGVPAWPGMTDPGHSQRYIQRFRDMAAEGNDLFGESRLIDAMVARHSRILDAGCGPGRTAGYLAQQGHTVVGIDVDPRLIEVAPTEHPGPRYVVGDLAHLDLASLGETEPFDAVLCAGNVMVFLAPGSETRVLTRLRSVVRGDGFAAVGFHVARYPLGLFDEAVAQAGWVLEQRFATWDLRPWRAGDDFAVSILRN